MNLLRLFVALIIALGGVSASFSRDQAPRLPDIAVADLPPEGRHTLSLIKKGGPFPYDRDGVTFGNFEKLLPIKARGHYREFTVQTPGARNRGARRIVAGKDGELFYTADHYKSFKRIRE
jgi:ribonuclease T1